MKKPETKFKERVVKDLGKLSKCWFFKTQEVSRHGIPDILGSINGTFFALELKTDVGDLDILQEHILGRIYKSGGVALKVCPDNWPDCYSLLEHL